MRAYLAKLAATLAVFVLIGSYALAQADVVCTPIGGVIVENHNQEFIIGEGIVVLGVISGDLVGATFFVWPPPGGALGDVPAEGVITFESGDILRVQSRFTTERTESGFSHLTEEVTILSGTGAYQRASGSFESHGSMTDSVIPEMVKRYQGEVCVPAR